MCVRMWYGGANTDKLLCMKIASVKYFPSNAYSLGDKTAISRLPYFKLIKIRVNKFKLILERIADLPRSKIAPLVPPPVFR